jgi:citrate lyase subunit beta/citryl-CoA lyase
VETGADAVIVDLEDAVPLDEKQKARQAVKEALHLHQLRKLWVRVNGPDTKWIDEDLKSIMTEGIGGIMVPKLETPSQVDGVFDRISETVEKQNIDLDDIFFVPLVETALSVENVFGIARASVDHSRLAMLAFGAADFTADLGINLSNTGDELIYPRARIAVASRAAGAKSPLDTPYMIDIKDRDGLKKDARRARNLGFQGKLCLHPVQVDVVNDVFSPDQAEIDMATRILAAYEAAVKEGKGAVQLDGKLVDPPVVERARQIMQWEKR